MSLKGKALICKLHDGSIVVKDISSNKILKDFTRKINNELSPESDTILNVNK